MLKESSLQILESSQVKAGVVLEIMIMSQKLKSTRNDGGRGWGWKMTTTWDSESGLYRENEGEETGSSHERRRMPTVGSMV